MRNAFVLSSQIQEDSIFLTDFSIISFVLLIRDVFD